MILRNGKLQDKKFCKINIRVSIKTICRKWEAKILSK